MRSFWNWSFANPDKIKPTHAAVYHFAIEHCNRLGWKEKFGFPSQMAMEATGIKNWRTYSNTLNELVDFGFIKIVEKSKNQYSSNIIAIVKNTKAQSKALDNAMQKHGQKQGQSTDSIDIQYNNDTTIPKDDISQDSKPNIEAFLNWFNDQKGFYTGKKGSFKVLTPTDIKNLTTLKNSYEMPDFNIVIKNMSENEWVKETNNFNPSHFLRVDNFNRYLGQGENAKPPLGHPRNPIYTGRG